MKMLKNLTKTFFLLAALTLALPATVRAWPTDSQWVELVKGGAPLNDSENDANGGVNVVPDDGTHTAAFIYNDGAYLFYRIRLDGRPDQGGNGILSQFGWGFEIDTDQNADDYEWLIMCDGISQPEVISLRMNTQKTHLGDPSDKAEYVAAEYPLPGNHRIVAADTSINGDQDYFLDFRLPYAVFLTETGITEDTLVRYFVGSSRSTNNLTENGADLVGGSDLYTGLGDYYTPNGEIPSGIGYADGSVNFVEDLDGFGDTIAAAPGDTLFLRVDDADQTADSNPSRTLPVVLTTPGGDEEWVVLSATGVSGKFTGSVSTSSGAPSQGDGTLQVSDGETITVTYLDAVDSWGNQNQPRTDTLLVTSTLTDLAVTKTVDASVASEGDTVTFTITVTNLGPHDAANVAVSDSLPAGLTAGVPAPSQGTFAAGTWNVGSLAEGATATLTLPATVDTGTAGQALVNTAALNDGIDEDGDGIASESDGNDSASVTVYVGGTDLRITKTVSDTYPAEGDVIDYVIRTVNLGPGDASGVVVEDPLPAGLTLQPGGINATVGSYDSGTGLWTIGNLASGSGAKLTLTVAVDAGTADSVITNTASLQNPGGIPDTNASNDSASVDIKVDYYDLQLTKSAENPSPTPGDDLTPSQGDTEIFTLTVTNLGPNTASGIEVTDLLPAGLSYQSHTAGQSYDPATGLWSVSGSLSPGDSAEIEITTTVTTGPGQTLVNDAEITASDHLDDQPGNDADSVTLKVDGTDVMVTKTVDNSTPGEGDTITYTVTVANNGPNAASGIEITDIPPIGVSFTSSSTTSGNFDDHGGNPSYIWSVGSLAVNQAETLTITATVDSGTSGDTIANVAMLTAADQTDPDELNNVDSAAIAVDGTDLTLTKTVDNATPDENQDIVYTLTLSNIGPSDATNIEVTDFLPPELEYVSDNGGGSYTPATGTWSVAGPLSTSGGTASLQITARVKSGTSGLTITNTAAITAMDQGDEDSSNDSASADVIVQGLDLAVTMTVDDAAPPAGGDAVFTVTVTNNGAFGATGVEIEDILPAELALVSAAPSQGSYAADQWLVGGLAAGASATLEITAAVGAGTAGTTITNTATLTALNQVDTNSVNDSESVNIIPVAAPSLTVIKSASGPTAAPGDVITYTVTVLNAGSAEATNVILRDDMSPYTAWGLDSFGAAQPFRLIQGSPASGLTLGTPTFSDNDGGTYSYTPASGGEGAPAGYDGAVTDWRLPMNGTMAAGGSFTLQYKVMVK